MAVPKAKKAKLSEEEKRKAFRLKETTMYHEYGLSLAVRTLFLVDKKSKDDLKRISKGYARCLLEKANKKITAEDSRIETHLLTNVDAGEYIKKAFSGDRKKIKKKTLSEQEIKYGFKDAEKIILHMHCLSTILKTLSKDEGYTEAQLKDFSESYSILLSEELDGRTTVKESIKDTKELTGIDIREFLEGMFEE